MMGASLEASVAVASGDNIAKSTVANSTDSIEASGSPKNAMSVPTSSSGFASTSGFENKNQMHPTSRKITLFVLKHASILDSEDPNLIDLLPQCEFITHLLSNFFSDNDVHHRVRSLFDVDLFETFFSYEPDANVDNLSAVLSAAANVNNPDSSSQQDGSATVVDKPIDDASPDMDAGQEGQTANKLVSNLSFFFDIFNLVLQKTTFKYFKETCSIHVLLY